MNTFLGYDHGANRHKDGWETFQSHADASKETGKKLKRNADNDDEEDERTLDIQSDDE